MKNKVITTAILGLFTMLIISGCGKSSWAKNEDLQEAAKAGNLQGVQKALKEGADINSKDYYGRTALIYAAEKGNLEIVRMLVNKGAKVNIQDYTNGTALIVASANGYHEVAAFLIDHGANLDAKGMTGTARELVNQNDTLMIRTLERPKEKKP